ncbi:LysR substrate-binding domain-containing protein [Oceanospirillum sediminis]|uniref:LysR family transcriptional regulator n=1 Tax=Oceanospirillum sediminis TaxID=2760088 RepID=A0A839IPT1_9GAMM|nr:LysR substrate-binding domain-containing protein [Oceanospirillum sediminis]MBB1486968.1 LysR family transcriptional regulator [Oceanospirillum sediminis]
MDLRKLKYFEAVAEEKHIGRAAKLLHISQPPLTRQIHQLEEELDVVLFNRTPKGMELTDAGELFRQEVKNIFALIDQATERTQKAGRGELGRLDIATFGSGILDSIPQVLLAFKKAYPEVSIVLHQMDKGEQIKALRQKRISLGFNRILSPLPDIRSELVTTEALLLAVNTSDSMANMTHVPFDSLRDKPLILYPTSNRPSFVDKIYRLCQLSGFSPVVSQEVGDAVTAVALVASGFGSCIVPESATVLSLPGVIYKPFINAPDESSVDLSCIYRKGDNSPLLKAFLKIVIHYRMQNSKQVVTR